MNIQNFMQQFLDEVSCIAYLKEQREQSGVICKRYGCRKHRWDANKWPFECKHYHSKLPFQETYAGCLHRVKEQFLHVISSIGDTSEKTLR